LIRKRGYSDIDDCNLKALELNTKASLQKHCEQKIKVVKDKHTGKAKEKQVETHQRSPHTKERKREKGSDILDSSSSNSSEDLSAIDQGIFQGFEYTAKSVMVL